jgi:hypothetical protein
MDTGVEPRRGIAVAEGMHADSALHEASAVVGCAEGPVDAAAMHGGGGGGHGRLRTSSGGQKPGRRVVCCPGVSYEGEGIWRAGDVAVRGPLAPMHVDHASWAVDGSNVAQESCVPSASQALDGGKGPTVVPGCGQAEQATHVLPTEESWEPVCGLRSHEVEALPIARQNVEGEEAEAARADAHGGGREVIDVCAMQHVVRELGFGDEVG